MPPGERGDFTPVATDRHGAPAATVRAGSVVEKKAAVRIGTETQPRPRSFGDDFGRGARHGSEQPVQTAFPGDKLDLQIMVCKDKFIVPFGDA